MLKTAAFVLTANCWHSWHSSRHGYAHGRSYGSFVAARTCKDKMTGKTHMRSVTSLRRNALPLRSFTSSGLVRFILAISSSASHRQYPSAIAVSGKFIASVGQLTRNFAFWWSLSCSIPSASALRAMLYVDRQAPIQLAYLQLGSGRRKFDGCSNTDFARNPVRIPRMVHHTAPLISGVVLEGYVGSPPGPTNIAQFFYFSVTGAGTETRS